MTTFRSFTGYLNDDLGYGSNGAQAPAVGNTFDISTAPALNIVMQDNDGDTSVSGDLVNEASSDADQFVFVENAGTTIIDGEEFYLELSFTFTVAGDPTIYTGYHFESDTTGIDFTIFPPGVPAGVATVQTRTFNPAPNEVDYDSLESADEIISETTDSSLDLSGDDFIEGGAGDDRIDGGDGADTIDGGTGDDAILGQAGADEIDGGAGDDRIFGGAGNDTIDGDDDDDLIRGGDGVDTIEGGTGNDTLTGGLGADTITGGTGDDTLFGDGEQNNSVTFNGTGNDGLADAGTISDFPTDALTVEVTFSADFADSNNTPLFSYATPGSNNEFLVWVSGGSVNVFVNNGIYDTDIPASALFDGTEHTFTTSWDSTTGTLNSYVDGVLLDTTTISAGNPLASGGNIVFGQEQDSPGGSFDTNQIFEGDLVEVRLWGDVRTPEEVAANAGVPLADGEDNLVSNWVPAADLSGLDDIAGTHPAPFSGDVTTNAADTSGDTLDGGDGNDQIFGGGGDDQITVGVGDMAEGGDDADTFTLDFDQTSSDGSTIIDVDGGTDGTDTDTLDLTGLGTFTLTETTDADGDSTSGSAIYDSGQTVNFSEIEDLITCFGRGTQIKTENGTRSVEELQIGDKLVTRDSDLQTIRWIGKRKLDSTVLARHPNLRPIRIGGGALGDGIPSRDLIVSPQHRIVVRSKIAIRMFETEEVFVAAKHLLGVAGVAVATDFDQITYYHVLCDSHEIIEADGDFAETLYTGTQAMKALTQAARKEIALIFGDLTLQDRSLALLAPKGQQAKKLVERHVKNRRAMYCE